MDQHLIDAMAKQMAFDDAEKGWDKLSPHQRLWYRALAHLAHVGLLEADYKIVRFVKRDTPAFIFDEHSVTGY